ncbi:H-NS family nucleoid-associated regulatory protein [Burkholderia sp. MSMB1078WGS]|uniref:H-NS histone family protein n=1 Tax=Burkholderia sp. MSMB1078WGS TaxID=1637900 RepID=UPI0009EC455C|nr:H-NS histone family protein [Burkholderia sp. MSMB1078WGS]
MNLFHRLAVIFQSIVITRAERLSTLRTTSVKNCKLSQNNLALDQSPNNWRVSFSLNFSKIFHFRIDHENFESTSVTFVTIFHGRLQKGISKDFSGIKNRCSPLRPRAATTQSDLPSRGKILEKYRKYIEFKNRLDQELELERRKVIDEVISEIRACIDLFKLSEVDIFPHKHEHRRTRKPKYYDPVSGQTWSGVGREPLWIRNGDRSKYLIKQTDL